MTGLLELILPPDAVIRKPGPSSWRLLGAKVGDGSVLRAGNVDFVFI